MGQPVSLDSLEQREEAETSPATFLAKLPRPAVIDEAQKAPNLFDEIKLQVDQKRMPGQFYLTGSASFSSRLGIRESLTGRIGITQLHPMSWAELNEREFAPVKAIDQPHQEKDLRAGTPAILKDLVRGGMPIPAFLRDAEERRQYWTQWLETTVYRDLARFFARGYDPDLAFSLLVKMGQTFREGELPTLKTFKQPARQVRNYLSAMEECFLLHRIRCHEDGIGKEVWLVMDAGLAAHLMGETHGEGASLTLIRHFLWNEWLCQSSYQSERLPKVYYKSAQGAPIDLIAGDTAFRIIASAHDVIRRRSWLERPISGVISKGIVKRGFIVAPVARPSAPDPKTKIGILPLGAWS